jgi:hypothetical protein
MLVVVAVSLAYFILSVRMVGAKAGIFFVAIWIAVFLGAVLVHHRRR